jgi:hypothetical protein
MESVMALPSRRSQQRNIELLRAQFGAAWTRTDEIFGIIPSHEILDTPILWPPSVYFFT